MREVIYIDQQCKGEKPVEFTHFLDDKNGWESISTSMVVQNPSDAEKTVYLGSDGDFGDLFAAYHDGSIFIFKGHLNSGKY